MVSFRVGWGVKKHRAIRRNIESSGPGSEAAQPRFVSISKNLRTKINNNQSNRINNTSSSKKINFNINECVNGRYNKGLIEQGQEEYSP